MYFDRRKIDRSSWLPKEVVDVPSLEAFKARLDDSIFHSHHFFAAQRNT